MLKNEKYLTCRNTPLAQEELKQLEIDLDVRLPPDYRGFLARFNGGMAGEEIQYYPVPFEFSDCCIQRGVDPVVLHRELSSDECGRMDLRAMWKNQFDRGGLPPGVDVLEFFSHRPGDWSLLGFSRTYFRLGGRHFLPIANSFDGDIILLCLEQPDRSPIYFYDHDIFPHVNREDLFLIAHNFTDFLNGLTRYPEGFYETS